MRNLEDVWKKILSLKYDKNSAQMIFSCLLLLKVDYPVKRFVSGDDVETWGFQNLSDIDWKQNVSVKNLIFMRLNHTIKTH